MRKDLQIAFVTQQAPFGSGEAFVVNELVEFSRNIPGLVVIPMRPGTARIHSDAAPIIPHTLRTPLLSLGVLLSWLRGMVINPVIFLRIVGLVCQSRSLKQMGKNLAVIPKAYWIAETTRRLGVDHIHAYWASTSATAAMFASLLNGMPWSLTCYRWDIAENNLLRRKIGTALFTRVADDQGRAELIAIAGRAYADRIITIRSGVTIPDIPTRDHHRGVLHIGVPASFVEKKGHMYLLEALAQLARNGLDFDCLLIGDGPMRDEIERKIARLGLETRVKLFGIMDHVELNSRYARGEIDMVVLPSIVTSSDEKEGIPVSLIEAMAAGVPIVSTRTGGIPELVCAKSGILVDQRNVQQLVDAIQFLAGDNLRTRAIGLSGRNRVREEYDVRRVTKSLIARITCQ